VMSVFRNGRHIETFAKGKRSAAEIVQLMIGRDVGQVFPPRPEQRSPSPKVLEVDELGWQGQLKNVSFSLGRGEILGIGGLDGQGQRELLLALFGVLKGVRGEIKVDGKPVAIAGPHQAKSAELGIALVPEERKTEGLMLRMSVGDNMSLASLDKLSRGGVVDRQREASRIQQLVERLKIKVSSIADPASSLSGGNQQKVVLAKWLMTEPRLLMLNDPTRGIDVGTKQEIYQLLRELGDAGVSILFYSTDYAELVGCCDRVLILYRGAIVRELAGAEITETNIVASSLNIHSTAEREAG